MLEDEEYPSDSEQSDEDFKPVDEDSDLPSEEDSDGGDDDADFENPAAKTTKAKTRKRKSSGRPAASTRKTRKVEEEAKKEIVKDKVKESNKEEDDRARAEALWADFLTATDSYNVPVKKEATPRSTVKPDSTTTKMIKNGSEQNKIDQPLEKKTVKEIFDFAGEKIEVEKEIPVNAPSTVSNSNSSSTEKNSPALAGVSRSRASGGLGAVLGQIGKPQKINTLEKTKMDWNSFKQQEGIEEELQTHNKGREGFLERQDFLERTDVRQFQIEKGMRQTTRRK